MDTLQPYKIGFTGLSKGHHRYVFDIGSDFFGCFDKSELHQANVHLELHMEKEENMLVFDFVFSGWVELECNRCLEGYREMVDHSKRLFVKFGDDHSEQTEEIVVIPQTDSHFDIAHYIYEFLHLVLPLRRVHPVDATGYSECNTDMLEQVRRHQPGHKKASQEGPSGESPFDVLKGIRFDTDN